MEGCNRLFCFCFFENGLDVEKKKGGRDIAARGVVRSLDETVFWKIFEKIYRNTSKNISFSLIRIWLYVNGSHKKLCKRRTTFYTFITKR